MTTKPKKYKGDDPKKLSPFSASTWAEAARKLQEELIADAFLKSFPPPLKLTGGAMGTSTSSTWTTGETPEWTSPEPKSEVDRAIDEQIEKLRSNGII